MFRNYLIVALRNLRKHKTYSAINIAGLAIGMACCALIVLYVQHEMTYDTFHPNGDRIYRVLRETVGEDGNVTFYPGISGAFAPALRKDFPEIENAVRVGGNPEMWTRYEGRQLFYERRPWIFVEPDFLTMFHFPFVKGNPETALRDPRSAVISEAVAQQYFGSENPIGKIITGEIGTTLVKEFAELVVTGIVRVPEKSIFQFDLVASTAVLLNNDIMKERWEAWDANYHIRPYQTYILLREGSDLNTLKSKLPAFMERYMGKEIQAKNTYHLQPLKRVHLHTHADYSGELGTEETQTDYADIQDVYLFSGIAILILLIACVNFMNLATARSASRAKEIGLRKVSGANRFQLIRQFLGEAILLSFLALCIGIGRVGFTRFQYLCWEKP